MAKNIQPVRGTRDLIDSELETYNKIIAIGSRIAQLHNYKPIFLPIFEDSSVFLRTLGESSDIVTKETYTFSDREKRTITLRPEFTAAMVRSIISNGLTQNMPQRFFTYGPLFRHERPQQGRYRQFYQFDCELFGSNSPFADLEVINILIGILKELDLYDYISLEINTIGDYESTEKYKTILKKYFLQHEYKLSEISQKRLLTNPIRILDSKNEQDIEIIKDAPNISDYLNEKSLEHHTLLCEGLNILNIDYKINNRLVRGLDYYTHTVFEVITNKLGAQNAIAAGGRYDKLVETMGGPSVPAVGFAIGIDRIHELMRQANLLNESILNMLYLIPIGEAAEYHAMQLALEWRQKGVVVGLDYEISTKKRLKIANREKAPVCIIFGEDELEKDTYIIRDMSNSTEEVINSEELSEIIFKYLKN